MSLFHQPPSRRAAVFQALLVTFLWSTSWVIIKFGLASIPPLTFAGLRYSLAFLLLLPFALRSGTLSQYRRLSLAGWGQVALLGLVYYALAQGAQFLALKHLPAVTVSLVLNLTSPVVALAGAAFLQERPSARQWLGIALFCSGTLLYFYPAALPGGQLLGLAIALLSMASNAAGSLMGRAANRGGSLTPLALTTASMGFGALLMLTAGVASQGLPALSLTSWGYIAWLAVVNTSFAFTLWNHTLRTLTAVESSILNSTMMVQIALLAWIFLGEHFGLRAGVGLLLAALGALLVQLKGRPIRLPAWRKHGLPQTNPDPDR